MAKSTGRIIMKRKVLEAQSKDLLAHLQHLIYFNGRSRTCGDAALIINNWVFRRLDSIGAIRLTLSKRDRLYARAGRCSEPQGTRALRPHRRKAPIREDTPQGLGALTGNRTARSWHPHGKASLKGSWRVCAQLRQCSKPARGAPASLATAP